jgi:hypothetical protein
LISIVADRVAIFVILHTASVRRMIVAQTILAHENVILAKVHSPRQFGRVTDVSVVVSNLILLILSTLLDYEERNQGGHNRHDTRHSSTNRGANR